LRNNLAVVQQRISENQKIAISQNEKIETAKQIIVGVGGLSPINKSTESLINYGIAAILELAGPICMAVYVFL
jgi:hypothetical protein